MRLIFFGSGSFGLPTLRSLVRTHEVALVVTQPDRPAGRGRRIAATEIARYAEAKGIEVIKPDAVNDPEVIREIAGHGADAFIVIAYGQKIGRPLLADTFAVNLHGSLLPKYRGAAPINWAVINAERETGVTAITLAERMDAGAMLGSRAVAIDPMETAGELHDRLAEEGPDLILDVLARHEQGTLEPTPQDESKATRAPKLSKAEGEVDFDRPAFEVQARIHGLTPWPGCSVLVGDAAVKLLRARAHPTADAPGAPGEILSDLTIACSAGKLELLAVQPAGGKAMSFESYCHGHSVRPGAKVQSS